MPKSSNNPTIIMQVNPVARTSEAYRSLRFNIEFADFDQEVKTIAITSARRGEGRTTTAMNLAVAYAQSGKRVMLLDADLRNPAIHLAFGKDNSRGLTSLLTNRCKVSEIIRESFIENLSIIMSGPAQPNPAELLASNRMKALLAELKLNYDLILIDTPSILTFTDTKIMAAKCDGVLLVVEHGKVKQNLARRMKEELTFAKARVMGVIVNKLKHQAAAAYHDQ